MILGLLVNERRAMPEGGDDGPSFHAYRLVHVDAAGARVGAATHTSLFALICSNQSVMLTQRMFRRQ